VLPLLLPRFGNYFLRAATRFTTKVATPNTVDLLGIGNGKFTSHLVGWGIISMILWRWRSR